jgi:hypothetical protein
VKYTVIRSGFRVIYVIALLSLIPLFTYGLEENETLSNEQVTQGTVFVAAHNTITVGPNYLIDGAEVTFVAGNNILFREGFIVRAGSTLHAGIGAMNGETISGNKIWDKLHYVNGELVIASSSSLELTSDGGVVFLSGSNGLIKVQGTLTVNGGVLKATSPNAGSWQGIIVENRGIATLSNAHILHARQGVVANAGSSITITGCTVKNNIIGVHVIGGSVSIQKNKFIQNERYAIKEEVGGEPTAVMHNTFSKNGYNYYDGAQGNISIDLLNTMSGNRGNEEE